MSFAHAGTNINIGSKCAALDASSWLLLQDAEGTVIHANFGRGARTEDRFENAGTRAAALAESEMSPMALVSDSDVEA